MPFPLIPLAMAIGTTALNYFGGQRAVRKQQEANMELAKYQNRYNSPAAQMARYKEAGLNPNLIYSQGNPGNMSPIPTVDVGAPYRDLGSEFMSAYQTSAQAELTQQKTKESTAKVDLIKAQTELVKANPYLDKKYVAAVVQNMEALAGMADNKFKWESTMESYSDTSGGQATVQIMPRGLRKLTLELDNIAQRYNLDSADLRLKGQVFSSMEFQNYLNSQIRKYVDQGDITGDALRMFTMALFQKFK